MIDHVTLTELVISIRRWIDTKLVKCINKGNNEDDGNSKLLFNIKVTEKYFIFFIRITHEISMKRLF
jgi:hypothetical protein